MLDITKMIAVASAFFAGLSAIFAAWQIYSANKRVKNERRLNYAVTSLERAYAVLTNDGTNKNFPRADRLAWLTCARLIEEFKTVKQELKNQPYLSECEGHEEHWRHQFYLSLQELALNSGYYRISETDCIEPISAMIIHSFADWPNGKKDPIDKFGNLTEAEDKIHISQKWFGLKVYLERYPRLNRR